MWAFNYATVDVHKQVERDVSYLCHTVLFELREGEPLSARTAPG